MSQRLQLVEGYQCVCKGWIVENNKYIFEYGGKDVKDFFRTTDKKLKLVQLKEFLQLVKDMHNQGYFFCRLSNHNLLCFDRRSPVKSGQDCECFLSNPQLKFDRNYSL